MARRSECHFRLSESEKAALEDKAGFLGMTVSDYMRFCANLPIEFVDGALRAGPDALLAVDLTTFRKLAVESRRWGTNFNQATHALNVIGRHYINPPRSAVRADEVVRLAAGAMANMERAMGGMDELVRIARGIEGRAVVRANLPEGW